MNIISNVFSIKVDDEHIPLFLNTYGIHKSRGRLIGLLRPKSLLRPFYFDNFYFNIYSSDLFSKSCILARIDREAFGRKNIVSVEFKVNFGQKGRTKVSVNVHKG